uniref:hypothetical protein n=1 Tax=Candidatus Fimivicinus sp. TaxID=3056640 RepID=UPI003FEF3FC1
RPCKPAPAGAGAVLWRFGAMPGHLARQTTTPSLPEGEEGHAGRGLGIVLKTVVAPVHRR